MAKHQKKIPLLDVLQDNEQGVITPSMVHPGKKLPKHIDTAVIFFRAELSESLLEKCKVLFEYVAAASILDQYIYDDALVIARSPLGGPAAAGLIETLIAFGVTRFIACGSSGLIGTMDPEKFLVANKAIRDEGLSHHYLPPAFYADTDAALTKALKGALDQRGLRYQEGTVWTTDAFFRETPSRIKERRAQGAMAVDMECASIAAVCRFRNVAFAQVFYFSDAIKQLKWSGFTEERHALHKRISETVV
ncbi:MAG: nucleoside phosphorylase, partial [Bacillota bacterium]